jgi:spermidine/putrescine transport system ATP-binding protein
MIERGSSVPLVELIGLRKVYGRTVAVDKVDLVIGAGEFVVLLGPSGSGKTTILSMIGGFVTPTEGRVRIGGADVTALPPARRPTATVFQDYALFPHLSVAANIGFGLAMHRVPKAVRARRVEEMLRLVGLEGFGRRSIHELSGGQRQRVALARAIAVEPAVLLLDEPLGALDLALRRQMQEELVRIQKRLGTGFVHVTHDQEEAMSIADTIVVMNQGRIEDSGPPARVYLRPASLFSATFMGESNILAGRVAEQGRERVRVETALGLLEVADRAAPGDKVHLSIRPEQLRLGPAGPEDIPLGRARVTEMSFQGTHWRCRLRAESGDVPLLLRAPVDVAIAEGEPVELHLRPMDLVLLRD